MHNLKETTFAEFIVTPMVTPLGQQLVRPHMGLRLRGILVRANPPSPTLPKKRVAFFQSSDFFSTDTGKIGSFSLCRSAREGPGRSSVLGERNPGGNSPRLHRNTNLARRW